MRFKDSLFITGDKDLVQSLLFDARATNVYSQEIKIEDKIKDRK